MHELLAATLARHSKWTWAEGMLFHENATPGAGLCRDGVGRCSDPNMVPPAATPVFADPITRGLLLDKLRAIVKQRITLNRHSGHVWELVIGGDTAISPRFVFESTCLGEALAKGLLWLWQPEPRTCNRHRDCDEADTVARAQGRPQGAAHCHDDTCEDCFGQ